MARHACDRHRRRDTDKDQHRRHQEAAADTEPKKATKLSFKDQHRLKEAEGLMATLPAKIAKLEADMADPALYTRDPAGFDKLSKAHSAAQAQLVKAEEDWMTLEEMREALESGR